MDSWNENHSAILSSNEPNYYDRIFSWSPNLAFLFHVLNNSIFILNCTHLGFFVQWFFVRRVVGRIRSVVKLAFSAFLFAEHFLFQTRQVFFLRPHLDSNIDHKIDYTEALLSS